MRMKDVQKVTEQLVQALAEVHSRGQLHCDLKPENIMFTHQVQLHCTTTTTVRAVL